MTVEQVVSLASGLLSLSAFQSSVEAHLAIKCFTVSALLFQSLIIIIKRISRAPI